MAIERLAAHPANRVASGKASAALLAEAADDYKSAFEQRQQVRKTPSWPRSWANSSLV